jgi:hypothetical protein
MAGDLIKAFRDTLLRISEIESHIDAEQSELAALRREVEELRALLTADTMKALAGTSVVQTSASLSPRRPIRTTSSVGLAHRVLKTAGGPMHVDDIIKNIEHMSGASVNKQTLVSNLSRHVKSGKTFRRVGPNTFTLVEHDPVQEEIRLVG